MRTEPPAPAEFATVDASDDPDAIHVLFEADEYALAELRRLRTHYLELQEILARMPTRDYGEVFLRLSSAGGAARLAAGLSHLIDQFEAHRDHCEQRMAKLLDLED